MIKIPLIKSTFANEQQVKIALCEFIMQAEKLSMGSECRKFEVGFSSFQSRKFSTMVNSGSSANLVLLQSLLNLGKLKIGDKVAFSAVTWATNVMPIMQLGLCPVPVDIEISTLNINSDNIIRVLKEHNDLKALFITNLLGFCADLDKIQDLCNEHGIMLIEDNCESLGSELKNVKLGNFGIASTCSSFVGHHISTIEGGLISTDDPELDEMFRMVRAHGWARDLSPGRQSVLRKNQDIDEFYEKYAFYTVGMNLRPTEISGFLGTKALESIGGSIELREKNYLAFYQRFYGSNDILIPFNANLTKTSCFALPIIFKEKSKLQEFIQLLDNYGIENRPIVGGNIARQPFYLSKLNKTINLQLPNADIAHENGVYLPNHPDLMEEEIELMVELLSKFCGDGQFTRGGRL